MEKELTREVVEKLVGWLDSAGNFVIEQAPLLVREILGYGYVVNTAWLITGILLLCAGCWCFRKNWAMGDNFDGVMVCVVTVGAGLIITIASTVCLLKIYFAPRLYILSELSGLV